MGPCLHSGGFPGNGSESTLDGSLYRKWQSLYVNKPVVCQSDEERKRFWQRHWLRKSIYWTIRLNIFFQYRTSSKAQVIEYRKCHDIASLDILACANEARIYRIGFMIFDHHGVRRWGIWKRDPRRCTNNCHCIYNQRDISVYIEEPSIQPLAITKSKRTGEKHLQRK